MNDIEYLNKFHFSSFSSNVEEEQESAFSEEAVESRQLKEKRAAFRSTRSKSESSAVAGGSVPRYLSWENVSFLGHEIRKTVSRGFHWIASPSLGKKQSLRAALSLQYPKLVSWLFRFLNLREQNSV